MGWQITPCDVGLLSGEARETERLPAWFAERGFTVQRWGGLKEPGHLTGVTHALVLFADGFEAAATLAWLSRVGKSAPERLIIVVTAAPAVLAEAAAQANVVLLVRPVLAWQLVDVIRSHLRRHEKGTA